MFTKNILQQDLHASYKEPFLSSCYRAQAKSQAATYQLFDIRGELRASQSQWGPQALRLCTIWFLSYQCMERGTCNENETVRNKGRKVNRLMPFSFVL